MSVIALLSDIHANLVALEAVLAEIDRTEGITGIWVMGDTVGYGPEPSAVLESLRAREAVLVAGNHDLAVATGEGLEAFNGVAAQAAIRHRELMSADERDHLAALPTVLETSGVTLVHGSLRDPLWEYVWDADAARASLARAATALSCNGHTHVPAVFRLDAARVSGRPGAGTVALGQGRALVNPGSVGQPRDRDPRASWALFDAGAGTVRFMRTAYDIAATQRAIHARGLPAFLAERLASGS